MSEQGEQSDETENQLRACFDFIDTDKSGSIDVNELMNFYRFFGFNPTDDEAQEEMARADRDDNGRVDYNELRRLATSSHFMDKEASQDVMVAAVNTVFERYDKDNSGTISKDELKVFLMEMGKEPLTSEQMDNLFEDMDTNNDIETLSREEMMAYVKKMCSV